MNKQLKQCIYHKRKQDTKDSPTKYVKSPKSQPLTHFCYSI